MNHVSILTGSLTISTAKLARAAQHTQHGHKQLNIVLHCVKKEKKRKERQSHKKMIVIYYKINK